MTEDLFKGLGVEITLPDEETFLKVKETLTRIGIASKKEKKLFQSCLLLHKQGRYSILHFKELFIMDGREANITEEDIGRRNKIAELLEEWNLVSIINPDDIKEPTVSMNKIKIINFKEKSEWALETKYQIGTLKGIR